MRDWWIGIRSLASARPADDGPRDGSRLADFGEEHGTIETPVRSRGSIGADPIPGPLLIDEYDTTVVVPPGWTVRRHLETATLVLEREAVDG